MADTYSFCLVGVITIISAVMMALVQHNYKRLLGFHAVSQVGYMILGFGLGSAIGIAAGLFHMINNAFIKADSCFLPDVLNTGPEKRISMISAAFPKQCRSHSLQPHLYLQCRSPEYLPFNGFASKWMIYQGIIDFGIGPDLPNKLWVVWLGLAVLGSALTLASFIKLIGGIFLSRVKAAFE